MRGMLLSMLSVIGAAAYVHQTVDLQPSQPVFCTAPVMTFARDFLASFKRRQMEQRNPAPVIEIARQGLISALDARFPLPESLPDPLPFPTVHDAACQLEWSAEILDARHPHLYFTPHHWCQLHDGTDLVLIKVTPLFPRRCPNPTLPRPAFAKA